MIIETLPFCKIVLVTIFRDLQIPALPDFEMYTHFYASSLSVVATNPMEIVKIRMQMQALLPVAERQNTMQVIKSLGLKGLYQGTAATLSRDVPFSVLFFPGYANIKALMADKDGNNSMISNLVAGVAAGALASGAVTPSDVIKTRFGTVRH